MTIVSNSAINPFIFLLFNSTSQRASAITRWKDVLVEFTLDDCSFKKTIQNLTWLLIEKKSEDAIQNNSQELLPIRQGCANWAGKVLLPTNSLFDVAAVGFSI